MAVFGLLVWLAGGLIEQQLYVQVAAFGLSTYAMVELNNSNALLNMYSRMVSCSFIALTMTAVFMFKSIEPWVVQLCLVLAYLMLSRCYQDRYAQGRAFFAFLFIGIASTVFVQALFFVPVFWILTGTNLMALSIRNLMASVLGLLTPWWFLAGWYVFQRTPLAIVDRIMEITRFDAPFRFDTLDWHRLITLGFVAVVSLTGIIHYLRNSYKDKIRTRMIYEILITMTILIFVFIVLQPQHFDILFGMLTVSAGVLMAHYISQTHTRITNWSFYIIVLFTLAITAYNLWIP